MRRFIVLFFLTAFLIFLTFAIFHITSNRALADSNGPNILQQENQDENIRQISASDTTAPLSANSPNIGFINSPSATFYQPDLTLNICYINWYYLSVSASPNYMSAMTVTLNTIGNIAYTHGFFQTSITLPADLLTPGFKATCGYPVSWFSPNLEISHSIEIKARETGGAVSTNNGIVSCPADIAKVMLPLITEPKAIFNNRFLFLIP